MAAKGKGLDDAMKAVRKLHTYMMHHKDAGTLLSVLGLWLVQVSLRPPIVTGPFLEPVDYKAWNLPDYPLVVKHPMDLGTIQVPCFCRRCGWRGHHSPACCRSTLPQSNLDNKYYPTPKEYADHVRLVWRNCMTYNKEGSDYHQLAEKLGKHFEEKFKKIKWTPAHGMHCRCCQQAVARSDVCGPTDMPTRMPTLADRRQFSQAMYSVGSATLGVVVDKLDARCPKCIRKVLATTLAVAIPAPLPAHCATFSGEWR